MKQRLRWVLDTGAGCDIRRQAIIFLCVALFIYDHLAKLCAVGMALPEEVANTSRLLK